LARPLPSIPSATGCPALFGDFPGTTGRSDFPRPFIIGVRPQTFRRGPELFPPGGHGISRFPCEMFPYVLGVCDRAGPQSTSRYRCPGCGLPLLLTASASRSKGLTRLNTRPARSPVNASAPPLRASPHDSGPVWVTIPSPYDFCIHYTSPVLTGAQGAPPWIGQSMLAWMCIKVCPVKAGVFSGSQPRQGKSQGPCSLDSQEEGN